MKFEPTQIPGCVVVHPTPHADLRGSFARTYCPDEFAAVGIAFTPAQINVSRNITTHTLRGLHFQDSPYAEAKVVSATQGRILDVVVDLRPDSPTFRHWHAETLDSDTGDMIYVPEGCAHGFLTLTGTTTVQYLMGQKYIPGQARGYRFDDPAFDIAWPAPPKVISEADLAWPAFHAIA